MPTEQLNAFFLHYDLEHTPPRRCRDCGKQLRENEYHRCGSGTGVHNPDELRRMLDRDYELLMYLIRDAATP